MGGGGGGKGGGGGSSIDPNAARDVYSRWYDRGMQGSEYNPQGENLPNEYMQYAAQGYQTGLQDMKAKEQMRQMQSMFAMPALPEIPEGPSYEDQLAAQKEQYGIQQRDQLFSTYLDAANAAADFVNAEIEDEIANARLIGVDYNITDEQRQQRINDYFATLWGEGQQQQLEGYIKDYGTPEGFEGFTITRGNAENYANKTKPGEEKSVGSSKPLKPTILTDEEETLGAGTTVLGV